MDVLFISSLGNRESRRFVLRRFLFFVLRDESTTLRRVISYKVSFIGLSAKGRVVTLNPRAAAEKFSLSLSL